MKIMKKRLLYLFMLISSVSLFMSCSDDDDVKYPDSLRGYTGNLLLVAINYDKKTKKHQCLIEKVV